MGCGSHTDTVVTMSSRPQAVVELTGLEPVTPALPGCGPVPTSP